VVWGQVKVGLVAVVVVGTGVLVVAGGEAPEIAATSAAPASAIAESVVA